jgi:hypothetical protein
MLNRWIGITAALFLFTGSALAQDEGEEMAEEGGEEAAEEEAAEEGGEEMAEESSEEAAPAASSGGAGYGMAGCGLGSILFGPDSGGFGQILAATTNGTSGNQTFGITSGTSNCSDAGGGSDSAKAFVETNRMAFAKDAARGNGETIASLAELAGCQDSAQVGSVLQQNFQSIFPSAGVSDTQVSEKVVETLKQNAALACGNLG